MKAFVQGLIDFIASNLDRMGEYMEKRGGQRFERWSKFLGRKTFLGMLTGFAFQGSWMGFLILSGIMESWDKALGTFERTVEPVGWILAAIYGAATATNVLEHREKAKVAIADAQRLKGKDGKDGEEK